MNIARIPPGWTINFALESGHIDADLTPPTALDDLIKEPSPTQLNSFPIGYPTREDALEALRIMCEFEFRHAEFMRAAYARRERMTDQLRSYFEARDAYLRAVYELLRSC